MRFKNKVAFITGAGSGIGRAIASRLSSEGSSVVVTDVDLDLAENAAEEIKKLGSEAYALKMDVTDAKEVAQTVYKSWELCGRIDLLINNAGVATMNRLVDLTEHDWDLNMDVNAKGVFLVTVAALKRMLNHDYGVEKPKIVNIASMAGKIPAEAFLAHYTASKFAVVGFTKAVAAELSPFRINVNCVCPGYVERTRMQERDLVWEAKLRGITPSEVKERYISRVPLGRLATPEDIAIVVAFLCSHDADYMTGQAVNVTGGLVTV